MWTILDDDDFTEKVLLLLAFSFNYGILRAVRGPLGRDLVPEEGELLREEALQRLGALHDLRAGLVEVAAVLEDAHHVAHVVTELRVVAGREAALDGLEVC